MVEVKEVKTAREKRIFASFNADMYRDNPCAIPDLVMDERDNFDPKKNPTYAFCDVVQFLAYRDAVCVGRIAGIINNKANDKWQRRDMRFTRVDFIDDSEVSAALFRAVEDWGRARGADSVIGPIGFTDLDQEGMLVEGFDRPGLFFTIYNNEYYLEHMERLGFEKEADWVEYRVKVPEEKHARLKKLSDAVLRRTKLTLVDFKRVRDIKPHISEIFLLMNEAYKDLYGVVELNERQVKKYVDQFILLINPEYVKLIFDENRQLAAFGFGIPSLNDAVKKSRGRLFPFGWYRILRSPFKEAEVLDLYLVGVRPELKSKGLPAVLMNAMLETAKEKGIKYAETGPELETNTDVQSLWKFFEAEQHKRRRCWKKAL